ncbi:MAG TPA: hypothetical protein VIV60_03200, partial [Polyangiaceae bacterium]
MTLPIRASSAFGAIVAAGMLTTLPVMAESEPKPTGDCVQNFENGQRLRKEGKLKAATESLIACSQPVCPQFIAKECTSLYTEAQASLPTITVRATEGQSHLLTDVDVYLDGELLTKRLDGRAVAVDPGVHELRFELPNKSPLTEKVLVAEGEKNKIVSGDFPSPQSATSTAESSGPLRQSAANTDGITPDSPSNAGKPGVRAAAYVVGGLGIVGLGVGATLYALANKDFNHLDSTCRPDCSDDEVNAVQRKFNWSYV